MHTFSVALATGGGQTIRATDTTSINPTVAGISGPIAVRGLVVSSFSPNANGFTVNFSKPFIPADLALYDTNSNTAANIVITGSNGVGPIHGSLLIDPSNQSLAFKATSAYLGCSMVQWH